MSGKRMYDIRARPVASAEAPSARLTTPRADLPFAVQWSASDSSRSTTPSFFHP